jgi:hypothetical protein
MGDVPENTVVGNKGLFITLKLAADPAVELDGNIKNARITNEDKDDLTFAEVKSGDVKNSFLNLTAIQSTAVGSLWRLLWDNPGAEFACVVGFHGNEVATEDEPHVIGIVKAAGRPEIGGETRTSRERQDFEYVLEWTDGPTLDEGA